MEATQAEAVDKQADVAQVVVQSANQRRLHLLPTSCP